MTVEEELNYGDARIRFNTLGAIVSVWTPEINHYRLEIEYAEVPLGQPAKIERVTCLATIAKVGV